MAIGARSRREADVGVDTAVESRERPFKNKVVLITGANHPNGFGAAAAREFARQGAAGVVITSRDTPESKSMADEVIGELEGIGTTAHWIGGDLSDPTVPEAIVKETLERAGAIDVLVNNAGITRDKLLLMMQPDDWDIVMNTNLRSAVFMTQRVVKRYMRNNGGAIVNVASVAGEYGNTMQPNYGSAKGGMIAFTRGAAKELAQYDITVNAVTPGFSRTDMTESLDPNLIRFVEMSTPMDRIVTPDDVAYGIVALAHPRARMITGVVLPIDGGLHGGIDALPGLIRRKVQLPGEPQ